MSDIQQQLDELRREVTALRERVDGLGASEVSSKPPREALNHGFVEILKNTLAREGKTEGIAIMRGAMLMGRYGSGTSTGVITITDLAELPSDQHLIDRASSLPVTPLALRITRQMAERFLREGTTRITAADLISALGVEADELDEPLRALIAREWVRWSKNAAGEDDYELVNTDGALGLLTLI